VGEAFSPSPLGFEALLCAGTEARRGFMQGHASTPHLLLNSGEKVEGLEASPRGGAVVVKDPCTLPGSISLLCDHSWMLPYIAYAPPTPPGGVTGGGRVLAARARRPAPLLSDLDLQNMDARQGLKRNLRAAHRPGGGGIVSTGPRTPSLASDTYSTHDLALFPAWELDSVSTGRPRA
jgi:hypothetical protein